MRRYSNRDVLQEAKVFLESRLSIIDTAELLNMPKSTLHWHMSRRLKKINYRLWLQANFVLFKRRKSK